MPIATSQIGLSLVRIITITVSTINASVVLHSV